MDILIIKNSKTSLRLVDAETKGLIVSQNFSGGDALARLCEKLAEELDIEFSGGPKEVESLHDEINTENEARVVAEDKLSEVKKRLEDLIADL